MDCTGLGYLPVLRTSSNGREVLVVLAYSCVASDCNCCFRLLYPRLRSFLLLLSYGRYLAVYNRLWLHHGSSQPVGKHSMDLVVSTGAGLAYGGYEPVFDWVGNIVKREVYMGKVIEY